MQPLREPSTQTAEKDSSRAGKKKKKVPAFIRSRDVQGRIKSFPAWLRAAASGSKSGGKAWKQQCCPRCWSPQHRLGAQRCSAVPPPLINDWTEQRQNRDQFLITIDANAASFRFAFAPKTGQGAPGSGANAHRGGNKARKVRKALTCSRRRSNFFQYWNIDPTSAAILGDIEEIFFSGCNKYVGWIPPSLNNITVAPQKKKTHTRTHTHKKYLWQVRHVFI